MSFKPSIIAFDYETALTDGTPSVEFYRKDFRAITAAFAWRAEDGSIKTRYCGGEDAIRLMLQRCHDQQIPTVVHNFQFEYGVTKYRFGFEDLVTYDTMRLVQVGDNGGKAAIYAAQRAAEDGEEIDLEEGLSLVNSASRWLPAELQNHKAPAYEWLRANGVKAGEEGRNLNKLPADLLESYNVADAVVTLNLYETLTNKFVAEGYDFRLDHRLYTSTAKRIARRKGRGVRVNREKLLVGKAEVLNQIKQIENKFREALAAPIAEIEVELRETYVNSLKSERGRAGRRAELEANPELVRFNIRSTDHLKRLFVDKLRIEPTFKTEESKQSKLKRQCNPDLPPFIPKPSFRASHLHTYGVGGEILKERGTKYIAISQIDSLYELSKEDGRWHVDLRAAGTATGRFAGGRHD